MENVYGSQVGIHQGRAWIKAPTVVSIMAPLTQISGVLNVVDALTVGGVLNVVGGTFSNGYFEPAAGSAWVVPDR